MKASIKFRDDRRPLVRAKVPISVLGLPLVSGVAAGDGAAELRLDLATAFEAGPSLRLSYRPNDAWKPFSLVVKTGFGPLGSPSAAPFSMAAEFSLLPSSSPSFSIVFKPSLGDFSVKKLIGSERTMAAPATPPAPEFVEKLGKENGFPMDITSAVISATRGSNSIGGIAGLVSGFEVAARSVLPVRDRAAVRFRWGVRVPAELRSAFEDGKAGFSFSKLPLLVMSKISIEHFPTERREKEQKKRDGGGAGSEVVEACTSVKHQLEALRMENVVLKRAVEELRDEVGGWKFTHVTREAEVGRNGGKQSLNVGAKRDYRSSDGKTPSSGADKTHGSDNVSEELKKALMKASTGAGH